MNVKHMPAGTQASILRAVIHEKHPKLALPAIASRFGVTYHDVRQIIDANGYPDIPRMRAAAADLEQLDQAPPKPTAKPATNPFDPAGADHETDQEAGPEENAEEKLGGDSGSGTHDGPRTDVEPPAGPDQTATGDGTGQMMKVKLADLHLDPDNLREVPRLDDADIIELADSIAEVGLLQPITVRRHQGQLVVVMGHRRLQAIRRLKWTTATVIVRGPMLPSDVVAAMLVENGQRRDLNPIEEARGLRLMKTRDELSDIELARKIGRSQPYVSTRLALLSLSAEDQAAVIAGDMTLVEGTSKGRLNSGKVNVKGQDKNWHLGPQHELALKAKSRCQRLDHPRGRRVGGMACGECWESVIRADAQQDFVDISQRSGQCAVCEQPVERQVEPIGAGR